MPVDPITIRLCTAEDLPVLHSREAHPDGTIAQRHFERQEAGDYFFARRAGRRAAGVLRPGLRSGERPVPGAEEPVGLPGGPTPGSRPAHSPAILENLARERLASSRSSCGSNPDNEAAIPMYIGLDYTPTGDHA